MPHVSSDTAAERMSAVAATLSATETGHAISFGVAEHHPDEGLRELISHADADMLQVRRSRRTAD
jgi:PleD family two-component response regulator